MNRPDWCPQDVRASANDVCNALGYILVDDQIAIARAIQNERERCARVAESAPMRFVGETERAIRSNLAAAILAGGTP